MFRMHLVSVSIFTPSRGSSFGFHLRVLVHYLVITSILALDDGPQFRRISGPALLVAAPSYLILVRPQTITRSHANASRYIINKKSVCVTINKLLSFPLRLPQFRAHYYRISVDFFFLDVYLVFSSLVSLLPMSPIAYL